MENFHVLCLPLETNYGDEVLLQTEGQVLVVGIEPDVLVFEDKQVPLELLLDVGSVGHELVHELG